MPAELKDARLLRLARAASTVHNFNAWNECWGLVAKTPLNSRKNESPVLIHRANATAKIPQNSKRCFYDSLPLWKKAFTLTQGILFWQDCHPKKSSCQYQMCGYFPRDGWYVYMQSERQWRTPLMLLLFVNPKYESSPPSSPPFYVLLKALVCAYIEEGHEPLILARVEKTGKHSIARRALLA